jgi:type II secretory pathway pseudopilin PulG
LRDPQKLGFFGKVGAWLHIWTPPKDVEIPPPPSRRRLAAMGIIALFVIGVIAALVIPPLQRGKEAGDKRRAAARVRLIRSEEASLAADQRIQFASGKRPAAGDSRAARSDARTQLERAITRDARTRVRTGKLDGPVTDTTCEPSSDFELDLAKQTGLYKCLVVTSHTTGQTGAQLQIGYPFVARVDYRGYRFAWCKTNPRPGEQAGHNLAHVKLDPRCAGRLSKIL